MAVDTTIQFNGHNSYKVTELLLAYPFGVQGMTYITHSFQVYCNSPLASATRAKTKFFDADGATLSEVSHAFAVPAVFEKVSITVPVPATAVQAQLVFLHGGTDWWFAESKSEEGQSATPYNVNYAGQLTYITPNGIYTGMVTANQIVVTGSIAQPDETLETRLVTINNNAINLSSTIGSLSSDVSNHESRVTAIEAGQITLSSRVGAVEPKVTKITSAGIYTGEVVATQITSGYISADRIAAKAITGAKMADGTVTDIKIATGISATKVTTGKLQSVDGKTWFDLTKPEIVQTATINGKAVKVEMSPTNPFKLSIMGTTNMQDYVYVTGTSGFSGPNILVTSKYDVNEDGVVDDEDVRLIVDYYLGVPGTYPPVSRMDVNDSGSVNAIDATLVMRNSSVRDKISTSGGKQLGVDSTGIWMSSNWGDTKTYIHTF
jgi:hypothetical protein